MPSLAPLFSLLLFLPFLLLYLLTFAPTPAEEEVSKYRIHHLAIVVIVVATSVFQRIIYHRPRERPTRALLPLEDDDSIGRGRRTRPRDTDTNARRRRRHARIIRFLLVRLSLSFHRGFFGRSKILAAYRDFNYTGTYAICLVIDSRFSAPRRIFIRVSSLSLLSSVPVSNVFDASSYGLKGNRRHPSSRFFGDGIQFSNRVYPLSKSLLRPLDDRSRRSGVSNRNSSSLSLYRDFRLERKFFISSPPGFLYLRRCSSRRFKLITSRFPLGLAEINNRPS